MSLGFLGIQIGTTSGALALCQYHLSGLTLAADAVYHTSVVIGGQEYYYGFNILWRNFLHSQGN